MFADSCSTEWSSAWGLNVGKAQEREPDGVCFQNTIRNNDFSFLELPEDSFYVIIFLFALHALY